MSYHFLDKKIGSALLAGIMLAVVSVMPVGQFILADTATSTPEGATVETGDAVSGVDANNDINTNTVETSPSGEVATSTPSGNDSSGDSTTTSGNASTTPEILIEDAGTASTTTASSTPEILIGDAGTASTTASTTPNALDVSNAESGTTTLFIDTKNSATSTTAATSTAETGENTAKTDEGTAFVDSGNAYAFGNIANTINSNFVGSTGIFQLLNFFGNIFGELSLSVDNGAGCSFLCFLTELFVSNYNDAHVENNLAVSASTGANTASSTLGDAGILTGNAFAAANVINMVNTNIIGSDYLAFIMNAFGSWEGDLVLPPGSFWEESSTSSPCCMGGTISAKNNNDAHIENNVGVDANSGDNSAESGADGSSTIETGEASAVSNVMTIANTNIFGNNLLLIYVRTLGNWSGHVFSLPTGVNIIGTGDGFIIDGFSSRLGGGLARSGIGSTTIANTNNARIINNVSASAFTGGNVAVAGGSGNASISTGNALAAANVVNIANTNIIGRNWLLAIVNVFGDWAGDLAFGRPDLWVGASAQGPSLLTNGATPRFTVAYRNNGNAPATQSEISFDFGNNLSITDTAGGTVEDTVITWDVGTINPGEFGSFSFAAQVQGSSVGDSQGSVLAMADMYEDDANIINNTDQLILRFYNKPPEGFLGYSQIYARLEIAKERLGAGSVYPGDEVAYKITVENKGAGHAYSVLVEDEMKNNAENIISQQSWNLDTVYPGEKVVIEYTVQFASSTPAGVYKNYALAKWYDEVGNYVDHSGHSFTSVEVMEPEESGDAGVPSSESDEPSAGVSSGAGGIGGNGDTGTSTETTVLAVHETSSPANTPRSDTVATGGREADVLTGARPVFVSDARPLSANLRNEIDRAHRNPWDPRNLLANISFASINYAILWAVLAGIVIYFVSRKREQI